MRLDSVLVTGANGQLGKCLKDVAPLFPDYNFIFTTRSNLDILNTSEVEDFFKTHHPKFCINCAAYTAVDKAEEEPGLADQVNHLAVVELGNICQQHATRLIHISTDYVFNGEATQPYRTTDEIEPVSAYGRSKAFGEQYLINKNIPAIIIRTSWVYSEYGKNFFKTMCRLGNEKDELNVVNDQTGSPTYAGDLAYTILQILPQIKTLNKAEILHFANAGKISWFNFAEAIMEIGKLNCKINPIPTSEFPTPAKRPTYSLLSTEKIVKQFGISIPFWKHSLIKCFKNYEHLNKAS